MAKPPIPHPILITPRLRLRQFRAEDAAPMHACLGNADPMRFWNHPPHTKLIQTERAVRNWTDCTPAYYRFWAVADAQTDRCLGMVNYHDGHIRNKRASIGYVIDPAQHRHGLAAEAVSAMLDYMFGPLGLHRAEAYIHPENTASRALAERLGFHCEGVMREHLCVEGEWRDDMVWALLAAERWG